MLTKAGEEKGERGGGERWRVGSGGGERETECQTFFYLHVHIVFPRLSVGSHVAERDIVQFVPFRNFENVSFNFTSCSRHIV